LREHALASASVGRVLGEVCTSLERPAQPGLLKLANVQHLATPFAGVMAEPHHVLDLVGRLHPTAAVGGTPTADAVAMIRSLEGMDRGRYAGPVGVFDPTGDGEFAIALRCAEISGARARLFAGAGLVRGSVPEDELEETRIKLQAMLSALE
ncbi:MAG: chorismate-binding protein, partial [Acidimicrobiia bacterium]